MADVIVGGPVLLPKVLSTENVMQAEVEAMLGEDVPMSNNADIEV